MYPMSNGLTSIRGGVYDGGMTTNDIRAMVGVARGNDQVLGHLGGLLSTTGRAILYAQAEGIRIAIRAALAAQKTSERVS